MILSGRAKKYIVVAKRLDKIRLKLKKYKKSIDFWNKICYNGITIKKAMIVKVYKNIIVKGAKND